MFQLRKITHSPQNLFTLRIRFYFCINFSSADSGYAVPEVFWEELQRLDPVRTVSVSRSSAVKESKTLCIGGLDFF